ncbi:MAG: tetratricopeptide repeat protein [Candidatus Cloacimonetes bacterium]|nr:tetratricopeptide repeat protein [Candidatus Cloacimonadota bacterium]
MYDNSLEWLDKAIALSPKYARAYYNKGLTYEKLGKTEKAVQALKTATKLDKTCSEYKERLADITSKL